MNDLQKVTIGVYSDADCQRVHYYTVHNSNICAGVPEGGKGQCSVSSLRAKMTYFFKLIRVNRKLAYSTRYLGNTKFYSINNSQQVRSIKSSRVGKK